MRKMENKSIFVEYFGESPYIKVLDFLIQGASFDYSMTEVARGAEVGWSSFTRVWEKLLDKKIILPTRVIGNAKLFRINKESLFVQKLLKLDWELAKMESNKVLNEEIVA